MKKTRKLNLLESDVLKPEIELDIKNNIKNKIINKKEIVNKDKKEKFCVVKLPEQEYKMCLELGKSILPRKITIKDTVFLIIKDFLEKKDKKENLKKLKRKYL